jgi:hypothetical protein
LKPEIFVSVDIEADGPIPGEHSMLSLGAVALTLDQGEIDCYTANLEPLPGARTDTNTEAWWAEQDPKVYAAARTNARPAEIVMPEFCAWLDTLPGLPVFVAMPAAFDFTFVYWYLIKYAKRSPFSYSALDIKTYAMALTKSSYRSSVKRNWPRHWFPKNKIHSHVALEDAREQAELFLNILKDNV